MDGGAGHECGVWGGRFTLVARLGGHLTEWFSQGQFCVVQTYLHDVEVDAPHTRALGQLIRQRPQRPRRRRVRRADGSGAERLERKLGVDELALWMSVVIHQSGVKPTSSSV